MDTLRAVLDVKPPFSFHLTASHQTYYRGESGADVYRDGVYRRALERDGRVFLASARDAGTFSSPRLELEVAGPAVTRGDIAFAKERMSWILGLDIDLAPFYRVLSRDPVLAGTVGHLNGLKPPRTASVFEALVLAICGQQISNVIARMIRSLLVQSYGTPIEVDGVTYRAFPSPQALLKAGIDGLRASKLSTRKAEYILDIAAQAGDGRLDLDGLRAKSNDEVTETLATLRGVGRWTAEWVLVRGLGRTDVFPAGDLALRRLIGHLYFGGEPLSDEEARAFAQERWAPYQALATTYLFAHLRLERIRLEAAKSGEAPAV